MLNNDLSQQIKRNFPYKPTEEQENAVKSFAEFLFSPSADSVFLMKGYAGTGKTTLTSALVRTLDSLQRKVILLAPTGRAAKVFSGYAEHPAYTIHKKIYRQKVFSNETDNFVANQNLHRNTLFIVDEASMIANEGLSGGHFGSGRLLDDLVQYVYNGLGCRLMLIGDTAQLPPIGEEESPALSVAALQGYGLEVLSVCFKSMGMRNMMVEFLTRSEESLKQVTEIFRSKDYIIVSYEMKEYPTPDQGMVYQVSMVIKAKRMNEEGLLLLLLQDFPDVTVKKIL